MEFEFSQPHPSDISFGLVASDYGLPPAISGDRPLSAASSAPEAIARPESALQDNPSVRFDPEQTNVPSAQIAARGERIKVTERRQNIRGTAGNDRIDARNGQQNRIKALGGNDKVFAGKGDRVVGGPGNDRIDARKGKGRNLLRGGGGDDRMFAENRDRLLGNGGDDLLDASRARRRNSLSGGGGNDILIGGFKDQLTGGGGSDEFWVARRNLPRVANTVTDFEVGVDQIGINGNIVSQFNDMQLLQQGGDTVVQVQGRAIAILQGVNAATLSADDFIGVVPTPRPQITIGDVALLEGNAGTTDAVFTVTLDAAIGESIEVTYTTVDGTAIAGSDYTASSGLVTFAPGETVQAIAVPIRGDLVQEGNETFAITVSDAADADVGLAQAIATILNDDISLVTAQGGNQFSQTATDRTNIESQFTVVGVDSGGNPIPDTAPAADLGQFVGAIAFYDAGQGRFAEAADFTNITEPFESDGTVTFSTGTLVAEFIDDPLENQDFGDRDTIEYRLLAPGAATPALALRLDFADPFNPVENLDVNQAINSLAYILEQGLLRQSAVLGDFGGPDGLVFNTQIVDTYTRTITDLSNSPVLSTELRVVDRLADGAFIADANPSADFGQFTGAIASFSDSGLNAATPTSFIGGNLRTSRSGSIVTYTLAAPDNSITRTAALDLALLPLDPILAVNDLGYILDNDLLQRAFFS